MPRQKLGPQRSVQLYPEDDQIVRQMESGAGNGKKHSAIVRDIVHEAFIKRRKSAPVDYELPVVGCEPTDGGSGFTAGELESAIARLATSIKPEFSCEEFSASLRDYFDNALDVETAIAFNLHARECAGCRDALSAWETAASLPLTEEAMAVSEG